METKNKVAIALISFILMYFGYNKFYPSCNDNACSKDSISAVLKDSLLVDDSSKVCVADTVNK